MEKIEWPQLGPMELARGLVVCASTNMTNCGECPMKRNGEYDAGCADELCRQAAVMIRRLYDSGEKAAEGLVRKLVDMAREGNTALERGLEGVNHAKLAEMTGVQDELEAFGRCSAIRAEPAGRQDGTMRIMEVTVEGRTVFSAECRVLNAELEDHSALSTQNSALVTADG